MPWIISGLAAAEAAGVFPNDLTVAPNDNPIGVSSQLGGAPRRFRRDAVVNRPGYAGGYFV
jgi:hypothetical protein